MSARKKGSRELGLLLARTLLDVDDLHYGLWEPDLDLALANLPEAQQRYSDMLLEIISHRAPADPAQLKILDVGCGTGHLLEQMLARGYIVDAVNPSRELNRLVKERLKGYSHDRFRLIEKSFEEVEENDCRGRYDILLFSESFQYIPLPDLFSACEQLTDSNGIIVIADFFKTDAHLDGGTGDRSMSGGHLLREFYRFVDASRFRIRSDLDLTDKMSPNLELLDQWLNGRIAPAARLTGDHLLKAYPVLSRVLGWLLRSKLRRLRYKYFSGHRGKAVFEKYKSYRLLLLSR